MMRYCWPSLYRSARLLSVTALSGYPVVHAQAPAPPSAAAPLVFQGATVIDMVNGKRLPDQTVVVIDNRIQAVGTARAVQVPKAAQLVDARGKYLLPGFWDMHVHVDGNDSLYPTFLAYGVTGIREMAQRGWAISKGLSAYFRARQQDIQTGVLPGPRMIGPSGDVSYGNTARLTSPEVARRVVDSLKAAGDPFIKYHGTPDDPAIFFALLREARQVGIPVLGHLPKSVSLLDAVDSGMTDIEHISGWYHPCFNYFGSRLDPTGESMRADGPKVGYDSLSAVQAAGLAPEYAVDSTSPVLAECRTVAQALIRHGTWLTPTQSVFNTSFHLRQYLPGLQAALRLVHHLGVIRFLNGVDMGADYPYSSLHSPVANMQWLVQAGFTPLEALQTSTLNPARYLGATDSLGTVAVGKLADLVLLDADPLADIANATKLHAVVANGRYYDRAALDTLLAKAGVKGP